MVDLLLPSQIILVQLSYYANNAGADGIIYNGVYDNGYNNNQVILSFKKMVRSNGKPFGEIYTDRPMNPNQANLNYSSPAYSMNIIEKVGYPIVYRLLKHGIAGMRITPLKNIDRQIPIIMDNHVFSRLGVSPPQKFYSDIYRGNKTFMEVVDPNITGIYAPGNRIIIKEGVPQEEILPHELRHKLDDIYNLSDEQQQILNKAYGDDFNSDEIKKAIERNPSYNMLDEAVTTNLDSRMKLFDAYNPSSNDTYFPIDLQNNLIDKMSDEGIIYAIQNSNRYGQAYIDYLKQNNLLTKDKIQAFRDAMKYVGGVSIHVAIGTSTQR